MSTTRVVHVRDNIEGAVYIGRAMPRQGLKGSPFANPFKVEGHGRERAIGRYEEMIRARLEVTPDTTRQMLEELRGKPLACWCRHDGEERTPDNMCHGDVLIELLEAVQP